MSIVDLMTLLKLDSSPAAGKHLATDGTHWLGERHLGQRALELHDAGSTKEVAMKGCI
jgi:hypothetical protein